VPLPVPTQPTGDYVVGDGLISSPSGKCGGSTNDDPLVFDFSLTEMSSDFAAKSITKENCGNAKIETLGEGNVVEEGTPSSTYRLTCDADDGQVVDTLIEVGSFTDMAGNLNVNSATCALTSDRTPPACTIEATDALGNVVDCAGGMSAHPPLTFTIRWYEVSFG
jgi:hypothetical protein